jgi:hypothetical protein
MILKPRVIVLDEPTSALDRSVQKAIVELLRSLQARHGCPTCSSATILRWCGRSADYIMVMKEGVVVEEGPTDMVFDAPAEAYTRTLMAAAVEVGGGEGVEGGVGPAGGGGRHLVGCRHAAVEVDRGAGREGGAGLGAAGGLDRAGGARFGLAVGDRDALVEVPGGEGVERAAVGEGRQALGEEGDRERGGPGELGHGPDPSRVG